MAIPIPPKGISVDYLPIPNDPNHDSFLGSEPDGTFIENDGSFFLNSFDERAIGFAASALEMLLKKFKFEFFYPNYGLF